MTVVLDRPEGLRLDGYRRVVEHGERVEVAAAALARVEAGRSRLDRILASGVPVYGVTSGLGYLRDAPVAPEERDGLQRALLTARAGGLGPPLSGHVVRGALLLRLNAFLSGAVGVGPALCTFLADRLDDGWSPVVPAGPYGAAGEIGPLAHLFQTIVGEGAVRREGTVVPAAQALADAGLEPFRLGPKEGLALVNGSPLATALGVDAAGRFATALEAATVAAALTAALTRADTRAYARQVGGLAADPAQAEVYRRLADLLGGEPEHPGSQPPVSLRVVPQVHGAALDLLQVFEQRLERRLGAVTDSPLVLDPGDGGPDGVYPSGGFHAAAPALYLDALGIAVAQVANLAERRLGRLLDARFSGLPEQLSADPGRDAGVVTLHKTAVGLAAEIRLLAAPASVQALETSSGQEDVQAFVFLAAERLARALEGLEQLLGCELVALRQAAAVASHHVSSPALASVVALLAGVVEPVRDDRTLSADVERAAALVRSGSLGRV